MKNHRDRIPVRSEVSVISGLSGQTAYLELSEWLHMPECPDRARIQLIHGGSEAFLGLGVHYQNVYEMKPRFFQLLGYLENQILTEVDVMQVETLKEVLRWTKEFHQNLGQCLSHCSDKNTGDRARMMLEYLSEHDGELTEAISGFEESGYYTALSAWCYEYAQHNPIIKHAHPDAPSSEMDAAQIMEVIVDQHQMVNELYLYPASKADIPKAKELLDSLCSLDEHEVMRMAQSYNRFSDSQLCHPDRRLC